MVLNPTNEPRIPTIKKVRFFKLHKNRIIFYIELSDGWPKFMTDEELRREILVNDLNDFYEQIFLKWN